MKHLCTRTTMLASPFTKRILILLTTTFNKFTVFVNSILDDDKFPIADKEAN